MEIDNTAILNNFDMILQMIYALIGIIIMLKVERHVTKQEANRVIDMFARIASTTKTKLDDSLVAIARMINNFRPDDTPTHAEQ